MDAESLLLLVAAGGLIYLLLNLYAFAVSDRLLFVPREPSYHRLPHEIRIDTADGGRLAAVHLEHPTAEYTILFSHGNAEDLGNVVPFMETFHALGYSVLMYDYRGYGSSTGRPSTLRAKADATAAYHWLVNEKGVDPRKIISQGRSLGGGVAVWLAAHHPVGGVITEISFASVFRVKTRWKLLPWDKFDSLKLIKRVRCPVLVIHGTADRVIPVWHGKKVFEAAPEPKACLWIPEGKHFDYAYVDEERYIGTIRNFIEETVALKGGQTDTL